jgi:amino acid permease
MQSLYSTFLSSGQSDKPAESLLERNGDPDKSDAVKRGASGKFEGASVASVASNLWNTIMGGGISLLALPTAAQSGGLVVFPIIMIVCGITAAYSADLLVLGCSRTKATGYNLFIRASLGNRWSYICDVLLFFFLLGTCASMSEAVAGALAPIIGTTSILLCSAISVIVSLVISLILPNLDALSPISQTAFWLTVVFLIYVAVDSGLVLSELPRAAQVPYFPSSWMGFFNSVSQISYSWLCHFNVLPIYHEMREPKREGWVIAMPLAILASVSCFLLAGMFSLVTHPTSNQTVFEMYAGNAFGKLLSFCFGLAFVFTLPLYQWVGSRSGLSLASIFMAPAEGDEADTESLIAADGPETDQTDSRSLQVMHFVWAALTFLFIALVTNLDNVITIISAIAAVPIMFIMPPLAWAYIGREETDRGIIHSVPVAYAVTAFGFVLWVGCLYSLQSLT